MSIHNYQLTINCYYIGEGIAADFDADGYLAGIEILDVTRRLGKKEIFKQVILEDVALAQ